MIRFAEHVAQTIIPNRNEIKISFHDAVPSGMSYPITAGWDHLSAKDWPELAKHIAAITVEKFDGISWPTWWSPQVTASWSSPSGEDFCRILSEKDEKLRKEIQKNAIKKKGSPIWLLIVCETAYDASSHAYPTEVEDYEDPAKIIREAGYNFDNSAFDEIWLMSEFFGGRSLRLYP